MGEEDIKVRVLIILRFLLQNNAILFSAQDPWYQLASFTTMKVEAMMGQAAAATRKLTGGGDCGINLLNVPKRVHLQKTSIFRYRLT